MRPGLFRRVPSIHIHSVSADVLEVATVFVVVEIVPVKRIVVTIAVVITAVVVAAMPS